MDVVMVAVVVVLRGGFWPRLLFGLLRSLWWCMLFRLWWGVSWRPPFVGGVAMVVVAVARVAFALVVDVVGLRL